MMESLLPEWALAGYQRERTGAVLPNVAPSNVYPDRRRRLVLIAANQDTVFGRLAEAMGRPELADDAAVCHPLRARCRPWTELDELIAEWTATLTADDLLAQLHAGGVPAGRIFRAKDMFADPHFAAREAIVRVPHPELGELPMQNVTPRLSRTPGRGAHRRAGARRAQRGDLGAACWACPDETRLARSRASDTHRTTIT